MSSTKYGHAQKTYTHNVETVETDRQTTNIHTYYKHAYTDRQTDYTGIQFVHVAEDIL